MCPTCTRAKDQARGTTAQRGYGGEHKTRAAALRKERRPCALCGHGIDYTLHAPHPLSFTAHHTTADKRGPLDAAHRVCNERAGKPASS